MPPHTLAPHDSYPLAFPRDDLDSCDFASCHSNLQARAPQLFVENESASKVEIREHLTADGGGGGDGENRAAGILDEKSRACTTGGGYLTASRILATREGLRDALMTHRPAGSTRIITIHRMNSWSRLKITLDMFKLLCGLCQLHPRYLSLIEGMGLKSGLDDEHYMTCYHHLLMREEFGIGVEGTSFGICYNVRHFESHGRDLEDPWSSRQSVIYQKYDFKNRLSELVVVQPPMLWKKSLDDFSFKSGTHPLALHLRYISSATLRNREYLNYMSKKLQKLEQCVSFQKPLAEFDFDFSLSQSVSVLGRKLRHLKMILESTIRTVATLKSLAEEIQTAGHVLETLHEAFVRELSYISLDLQNFHSTTNELLDLSIDIKSIITSLLNFRNQEILNKQNAQLHHIAENDAQETKSMAQLSRWMYNDSRTMRIATVIAMVYLPANLVLSFFSTVFVEFKTTSQIDAVPPPSTATGGMLIHGQLWIAIALIAALIIGTIGAFCVWDRRQVGHRRNSC